MLLRGLWDKYEGVEMKITSAALNYPNTNTHTQG